MKTRRDECEYVRGLKKAMLAGMVAAMIAMALAVVVATVAGCNPRVIQCSRCGNTLGIRGGLLPGQNSRCGECGGRMRLKRRLTQREWNEARERGTVEP